MTITITSKLDKAARQRINRRAERYSNEDNAHELAYMQVGPNAYTAMHAMPEWTASDRREQAHAVARHMMEAAAVTFIYEIE